MRVEDLVQHSGSLKLGMRARHGHCCRSGRRRHQRPSPAACASSRMRATGSASAVPRAACGTPAPAAASAPAATGCAANASTRRPAGMPLCTPRACRSKAPRSERSRDLAHFPYPAGENAWCCIMSQLCMRSSARHATCICSWAMPARHCLCCLCCAERAHRHAEQMTVDHGAGSSTRLSTCVAPHPPRPLQSRHQRQRSGWMAYWCIRQIGGSALVQGKSRRPCPARAMSRLSR